MSGQGKPAAGEGRRRASDFVQGADVVVSVVVLAVAGWVYWLTTSFEQVSDLFAQDVPPEFLPRLLVWTIVVLSVLLPFEHLLKPGGHFDAARAKPIAPMAWWTAGLLFLVVLSIKWASAYLATIAVCVLLPLLWGERRWHLIIPYALIFPTLVMIVFSWLLGVYFEPGLLGIDFR